MENMENEDSRNILVIIGALRTVSTTVDENIKILSRQCPIELVQRTNILGTCGIIKTVTEQVSEWIKI